MTRLLAVVLMAASAMAQSETATEQAVRLANQGNVERAIQVLRDHLKSEASDLEARLLLGQILDFDGRPDEAVTVWEAGISGHGDDFPLLMSIGEIRRRQGTDGPTISYRRGMVGAMPSKDKAGEEQFKRDRLSQAAKAFEQAKKARPAEAGAVEALASVYSAQKRHDAAVEIWESLVAREPSKGEYRLQLALAAREAGRIDNALQQLRKAIELSPRSAEAHAALAEIQQRRGEKTDAELSRKRAEFYERLPAFSMLVYSAENQQALDSLDQEKSVRKLIDDPSGRAAELLAILCWSHPHNVLETRAFQSLEARGSRTTSLLWALLDSAQSTCTIKSTAHILARRKVTGILDRLVKMLPGDTRGALFDMDIAGSLDDLGDPRAVGPLVQVLDPRNTSDAEDNGLMIDRRSARARAAMALGALDTPESRRALETGTRNPQLAPYCLAALYRLTPDPKRLEALEKSIGPEAGYTSIVVGDYLVNKVHTKEAEALAKRWEARRRRG